MFNKHELHWYGHYSWSSDNLLYDVIVFLLENLFMGNIHQFSIQASVVQGIHTEYAISTSDSLTITENKLKSTPFVSICEVQMWGEKN